MEFSGLKKGIVSLAFAGAAAGIAEPVPAQQNTAPSQSQGYKDFADFVAKNNLTEGKPTVFLNRTVGLGMTVTVEQDPKDPMKGRLNYNVAHNAESQVYELKEEVRVQPNGDATTSLSGVGRVMEGRHDRALYDTMLSKYGSTATDFSKSPIVDALSQQGLAFGSSTSPGRGDYLVRLDPQTRQYDLGSCIPLSAQSAFCGTKTMDDANSSFRYNMELFRLNADGIVKEENVTYQRDFLNQRERDSFEKAVETRTPGINRQP